MKTKKMVRKEEEDMTGSGIIKIENLKISSEANHLLINANLTIDDGKRYGLVGLDSCGRTTLLKYIANNSSGVDVLYWDEGIVDHMLPPLNAIIKPSTKCQMLLAERENLTAEKNNGNDTESVRNRLAELKKELLMIDPKGWTPRGKAINILSGLGLPDLDEEKENVEGLPECVRKKVSLARALYLEPALLILDEPTTDLDVDAILWLENRLQDWKRTLIVVSQDRCFLDNVCKEIIHVNHQQFFYYKGNYSFFEKVFAQKQRRNLKKKEKKKEKKLQLKTDEKLRDTSVQTQAMTRSESLNGSEANGSGERIAPAKLSQKPEFLFCDPINNFKRIAFLRLNCSKFYYEKGKPLFVDLDLVMFHKSRVAVLGPRKAGKSTLLKIANKEVDVKRKQVYLEPGAIIGKFSENDIDRLSFEESPLQYLCKEAADQETFRLKAVEKLMGLGLPNNRQTTKMEELTVNEKALVALAKFCLYPHDLLLLDDPTKYLSIDSIDALAYAINEFKGAVLMVTNNQFLLRETASNLIVIDEGHLKVFTSFEKYRRKVLKNLCEPIRGPFTFIRRYAKRDESPIRVVSDSKIILDYIAQNDDVDPNIKNMGEYELDFTEHTSHWICYSPTLDGCCSCGDTKELCKKNMMYSIESWIEMLIRSGKYVPGPP